MSEPSSPVQPFRYVTGGTLKPGEPSYVERRADTELYESILAGEFCYVLTARQMGKSSLMARTAKRLEQAGVASAIVDLTQIGSERNDQAAAQWYFGIANLIHRQLGIATPLRSWWQERADLSPVQRLTDFFRELVLTEVTGRVVIFVDEIDSTIGLPFGDDFFAALRACFNARATDDIFERFTFVLLGVATPDQLIRDPRRTPFNIGKRIDLTDFTLNEAQVLALGLHPDHGEAGKRLERVLYWTGGHPYLTQALCRAVREKGAAGTAEEVVDPEVEELFLSSRAQREETNLKHARARLERHGAEGRRLLQLYRRVRQGKRVPDQPTSPLFAQLKLTGVVKATDEGRLAVCNLIYKAVFTPEWAKAAMPADRARKLAAAAFAGVLVWYAVFQPRPYEEAFRAAIKDDGYNGALDAYTALRRNPFSRSRATDLMQQFWKQRALRYALAGHRDESILCYLKGLELKDDKELRRRAENLIGSDYERLRLTLRHADKINAVAFSPDGRSVLTADDTAAHIWDVRSGMPITPPLEHQDAVLSVAFSPDGRVALTGSGDKTARLWDARSGGPITPPLHHKGRVVAVAFSPDSGTVLTGSDDNTARLWNARSGKPCTPPLLHQDAVIAVAFSPDGGRVLTGSWDKTARIWDTRSGKAITPPLRHQGVVDAVAFSPDGKTVLTGSWDATARLWDAHSGSPVTPPLKHLGIVGAVAFSPNGRTVLTGAWDHTARLWDVRSGKPLTPPLRHQGAVWAVAFSPDGEAVLTGSSDATARLWDAHSGRPLTSPFLHQNRVVAVAFSPDGGTVLTGSWDNTSRLWDARFVGAILASQLEHKELNPVVALSPNGEIIITGNSVNTAQLWDSRSGKAITPPLQHQGPVRTVAFSPDGDMVVTGSSDKTARLWDTHSGKPIAPPLRHLGAVGAVAFSPDGGSILTGSSDKTARLWEARSGRPITPPLQHQSTILAVAMSPDGRTILTGTLNKNAQLWDVRSGKPLAVPLQHQGPVESVAFSPDSETALTGSWDNTIRLWNARTGRPLGPTFQLQSLIRTVAFHPKGKVFFAVTDYWLNVYFWDTKKASAQSSQLLHQFWTKGYRFPSYCQMCIQSVFEAAGSAFYLKDLHLDEPSGPSIEGEPKALFEEWRTRLGLRVDDLIGPGVRRSPIIFEVI